jgi:hypothetical protein
MTPEASGITPEALDYVLFAYTIRTGHFLPAHIVSILMMDLSDDSIIDSNMHVTVRH